MQNTYYNQNLSKLLGPGEVSIQQLDQIQSVNLNSPPLNHSPDHQQATGANTSRSIKKINVDLKQSKLAMKKNNIKGAHKPNFNQQLIHPAPSGSIVDIKPN